MRLTASWGPDRDGKVLNTLALDVVDGQIQGIRLVINPTSSRTWAR
jgi:hypothetical protein